MSHFTHGTAILLDTGLKPEVNAKEFYRIYANTAAK